LTFAKRTQCKREEKVLPSSTQRNDKGKEQLQGERAREGREREERGHTAAGEQQRAERAITIKL
jgi:hypothetical protein